MRAQLWGSVGVLLTMACGGPVAPSYDVDLSITDSVVARRSQNEVSLSIQVKLTNHDSRPLYYEECGHAVQRRVGTTWEAVSYRFCGQAIPYSLELPAGDSRLFTFRARAATTSSEWPAVGAPGEYRVVLWLSAVPRNHSGIPPQPLAIESRTSPVFSVREVVIVLRVA